MYKEELLNELIAYDAWDLEEKNAMVKIIEFLNNNNVIITNENVIKD